MATTPGGLPYPVGTDRVMDGDDAIHSLAQTVEDKLGGQLLDVSRGLMVAGWQAVDIAVSGQTLVQTPAFTCPAGRYLNILWQGPVAPAQGGTGFAFMLHRWVDGVDQGVIARRDWQAGGGFTDSFSITFVDAPAAGQLAYSMYAAGHGANGNVVQAGSGLVVMDVGTNTQHA